MLLCGAVAVIDPVLADFDILGIVMQPIQFTGAFVKNVLNQPAFYTQLEFSRGFYDV
jgi:hypothetical protein